MCLVPWLHLYSQTFNHNFSGNVPERRNNEPTDRDKNTTVDVVGKQMSKLLPCRCFQSTPYLRCFHKSHLPLHLSHKHTHERTHAHTHACTNAHTQAHSHTHACTHTRSPTQAVPQPSYLHTEQCQSYLPSYQAVLNLATSIASSPATYLPPFQWPFTR